MLRSSVLRMVCGSRLLHDPPGGGAETQSVALVLRPQRKPAPPQLKVIRHVALALLRSCSAAGERASEST